MLIIETAYQDNIAGYVIMGVLLVGVLILVLLFLSRIITTILDGIELLYAMFTKRPIFIHFYPFKKELPQAQRQILEHQFTFYKRLDAKSKAYFRHRVAVFLKAKTFQGKQGFIITDEVKVLIAATAIMLTFGFRNYTISYLETILVYPTNYYSRFTKTTNKGEFNLRLKSLVLSWDNFKEGYRIEDDKLNLGIHEFAHAIHYSCIKNDDINSVLFIDAFSELRQILANSKALKDALEASELIRSYAFTNDWELLAVIMETYIEAPVQFEKEFPLVYSKVKEMLNLRIV